MIRSERPWEQCKRSSVTPQARSRAKCTCIRWPPIEGRQWKSWKLILLDPNRTQVLVWARWSFQDLLVQKKLLVGARRFELLTPCAQGRCATRLRYAPTLFTTATRLNQPLFRL